MMMIMMVAASTVMEHPRATNHTHCRIQHCLEPAAGYYFPPQSILIKTFSLNYAVVFIFWIFSLKIYI